VLLDEQHSMSTVRLRHSSALARRGATVVEYAMLIIAVMMVAALAYRTLGKSVRKNADKAAGELIRR
jgi:Flp pilus assembly pilin Flp